MSKRRNDEHGSVVTGGLIRDISRGTCTQGFSGSEGVILGKTTAGASTSTTHPGSRFPSPPSGVVLLRVSLLVLFWKCLFVGLWHSCLVKLLSSSMHAPRSTTVLTRTLKALQIRPFPRSHSYTYTCTHIYPALPSRPPWTPTTTPLWQLL